MDVLLSEEQRLLQDATRRYLQGRASIDVFRARVESGQRYSADHWREGAAQGWVALFVPEAQGGCAESARSVVDAAIIAEEMGRVVYPGYQLSSAVAAFAINQSGSEEQWTRFLPALAAGEAVMAWCFACAGVHGGIAPEGIRVVRSGEKFTLQGVVTNVEDAACAEWLLVTASGDTGVSQFLVPADFPGITIQELETLDLGRRLATVEFSAVSLESNMLLGAFAVQAQAFERQLQLALVLRCAETVGVIDRVLEFTLEYVQQRFAFGRPIGSFQALKHRLADHAAQLEGAKALVARAATAVEQQAGDAAVAVSMAKSHCGRHGTEIIRDCLHMHGGIGMTWEHDIHFYLRRAVSNEALWGTPAVHHERLCRLAGF